MTDQKDKQTPVEQDARREAEVRNRYPTTPPPPEHKEALEGYRETQLDLHKAVLDAMQDAVVAVDHDLRITYLNPAARKLFAVRSVRPDVADFAAYVSPLEAGKTSFARWMRKRLTRGKLIRECGVHVLRMSGEPRHGVLTMTPILREHVLVRAVAVIRDLSEHERLNAALEEKNAALVAANQKLLELACTDAMTGTLNRRAFVERLTWEIGAARRRDQWVGVLYIDPNRFKPVNDTFGHDVGDDVLKRLATLMQETVRAEDIVGRLGGDEFAVLLPDVDPETLPQIAKRMADALALSLVLNRQDSGQPVKVELTSAIGAVTLRGTHLPDAEGLLKLADLAMYTSKKERRPFVIHDEG